LPLFHPLLISTSRVVPGLLQLLSQYALEKDYSLRYSNASSAFARGLSPWSFVNSAWIVARSDGVRVGFCGGMFDDEVLQRRSRIF